MKPRVYIETTIVGHLSSRLPGDPVVVGQMLATRKWWAESQERFELCTSEIVVGEASRGDAQAAAERLEKIAALPLVPIVAAAVELAELLLSRSALPAKARIDAVHVAVAATNSIEYLLTWNCRHLANATLRARIEQTCRDFGFLPPLICTPLELDEVWP
jgi:predicted nucleic acid-binding protein